MVVNNFIKLLDDLLLCLHLLLQLVGSLQDLGHINGHLIDILSMMIPLHPDFVDLVLVALEDASHFLGHCSEIALQAIPLWYWSVCLHKTGQNDQ